MAPLIDLERIAELGRVMKEPLSAVMAACERSRISPSRCCPRGS
jgi:hypothetical protein